MLLLGCLMLIPAPAAAQSQGSSTSAAATQGARAKLPGPFADNATIEARLQEIVDLAKKSSENKHRYDIRTLTCEEFLRLSASKDPDDYAVMAMLMVWTHGYHSGLKGINFQAYPLDTAGVVSLTTQMVAVCRKNPRKLFHVAAAKLD